MQRRTTGKSSQANKSGKRSKASSASIQQLEKDFRAIPSKLTAQSQKDLNASKQQEAKLRNELKKLQAQQKIAKEKHQNLLSKNKTKPSLTARKQISAAKSTHDKISQSALRLTRQLAEVKAERETLTRHHAKCAALQSYLNQFEKNWEKKKPSRRKSRPASRTSKTSVKQQQPQLPYTSTIRDLLNTPETSSNTSTPETAN